jgi:hypothetical protein
MAHRLFRIIYFLSFALFPWLVLGPIGGRLGNIPLRLAVFCILALGGAWLFRKGWSQHGWGIAILFTALGYGTIYKIASLIPDVSTYPFSLAWSEASRYYYASLWLSSQTYGFHIPPAVLHPSRYLMQAIPFLIPNSPLWLSRLWQDLLWVVMSGLAGWLLAWKLSAPNQKRPITSYLAIIFWAFLFLFQGPVYYHLLLMVIVVLWGFDSRRFWRTLILVLLASVWAGISRINWLPVPGMLAATLYLSEVRVQGKLIWRYLVPPAIWVIIGTGAGYATQQAYQLWSGNPPALFGSSFTSDLLWYRLLPNPTYPLGVLPSAIMVSLPILCLVGLRLLKRWRDYHPIRLLGLATILFVLFAGGIIVSVKIGGGSNLHNLDAYLSLLLVIGSLVYFERLQPDHPGTVVEAAPEQLHFTQNGTLRWAEGLFIAAAVAIPLYFTLVTGSQLPQRDFTAAQSALQTIRETAQQAAQNGGEVLFINQRHLLTFNYIKDVPLVPEDELVFLMEMAMSNNTTYMDAFHSDIQNRRFALIVSEPLTIQYQGRSHSFGEENDAWVERVSEPVLCYYEPSINLDSVGVVLYVPRSTPCK